MKKHRIILVTGIVMASSFEDGTITTESKPHKIELRPEIPFDGITMSDEYHEKSGKHMGKKHKHKNKKFF